MSEMALTPERMERVPAFCLIIEKHVLVSISCRMNLIDFARAKERVKALMSPYGVAVNFQLFGNPYFFAFRGLLDQFHNERKRFDPRIPLSAKVHFIFDTQTESKAILDAWDEYLDNRDDDIRAYYGSIPRFVDDQDCLALQAADFWAWWVREWYEEDASDLPDKMAAFDFGRWQGRKRTLIAISLNEDKIVDSLQALVMEQISTDSLSRS
jgi:hypothetical protein